MTILCTVIGCVCFALIPSAAHMRSQNTILKNKSLKSFIENQVIPYLDSIGYSNEKYYIKCDIGTNPNRYDYCVINTIPKVFLSDTDFMSLWKFYHNLPHDNTVTNDNIGFGCIDGYIVIINGESNLVQKHIKQTELVDSFPVQFSETRNYNADATWYLIFENGQVILKNFQPPLYLLK